VEELCTGTLWLSSLGVELASFKNLRNGLIILQAFHSFSSRSVTVVWRCVLTVPTPYREHKLRGKAHKSESMHLIGIQGVDMVDTLKTHACSRNQ